MLLRRLSVWSMLVLLLSITGGGHAQDDAPPVQVGVVVHDGTQTQTFCVELAGDAPTGLDALEATGLDVAVEQGALGSTICRIEDQGCTPPDEPCFCECMPGADTCAYWSYFHLGADNTWQYSPVGASNYPVADGAVEGWWFRQDDASGDSLPPVSFDEICSPQFPRTVTDGLGHAVVIDTPPERIASVTLGSDEILLALVGPERMLGVTHFAGDPAISNIAGQLDGIPRADLSGDPELLITLDADLVVMSSYNNPAALDQLLDADVPVLVLNTFNSLDDIRANIRLLGRATGTEQQAAAMIETMGARLAAIRAQVADQEPVRVLYYEPGGITYGPGSSVHEIITLAGGINVVAEAGLSAYPLVDPEFVLVADPDVILLGGWFSGEPDPAAAFSDDPVFGTLRAVQSGRVYTVSDAHMTTVSQYVVRGVEDVARILYPDAFEDDDG
jgi:iron complex transport system substrate-binding protein